MAIKPDLERVKRSKIKDQIVGQLRDLSARGVWPTGSQIPSVGQDAMIGN